MGIGVRVFVALLILSNQCYSSEGPVCVEEAMPSPEAQQGLSVLGIKIYGGKNSLLDLSRKLIGQKGMSLPDWTSYMGQQDSADKIQHIYSAANEVGMPPTVLAGAILQESGAADLGIGRDFDNWTCGPSQFSVLGWCEWAQVQSSAVQDKIGWPRALVADFQAQHPGINICAENSFIAREHLRPFYEIAMHRMKKKTHIKADYMLQAVYLTEPAQIQFDEVKIEMIQISKTHQSYAAGDDAVENLRFLATRSFAENCSNHRYSFHVMAFMLKEIFEQLPVELKQAQQVSGAQPSTGNPEYSCQTPVTTNAKPLHVDGCWRTPSITQAQAC